MALGEGLGRLVRKDLERPGSPSPEVFWACEQACPLKLEEAHCERDKGLICQSCLPAVCGKGSRSTLPSSSSISGPYLTNKHPPTIESEAHSPSIERILLPSPSHRWEYKPQLASSTEME